LEPSSAERVGARTGDLRTKISSHDEAPAPSQPEPDAVASEVSLNGPHTPECVASTSPVPAASALHTTFSLQERLSPSLQATLATQSMSPGRLETTPGTSAREVANDLVRKDGPLQHEDSALPSKELHEATQPQNRAKQHKVSADAFERPLLLTCRLSAS
jgi:hypothetical protein